MSQNDNRDLDPREDGVALSPYDDDLAPATEPPPPAPELPAEDEPALTDADAPAEDFSEDPSLTPEWLRVREEESAVEDAPLDADEAAAARLPYDETAARRTDAEADADGVASAPVTEADDDVYDSLQETAVADAIDDEPEADALADETYEEVTTSTYEIADPSDTAIRRTSLLRPADDFDEPEAEPVPLAAAAPAIPEDDRASSYGPEDSDLFAGATYDKVPSRAGAHAWSLITILLVPIAWYLLSDAGARMTLPEGAAWSTGTLNLAAVGELLAGLVVAFVVMLAARASSLGVFITGILLTVVGGAFVVAPAWTKDLIDPAQDWLRNFNAGLGGNIAHHLEWDGATGRILVIGIGLMFVAMVSHFARRRGRDEEKIRGAIAQRRPQD